MAEQAKEKDTEFDIDRWADSLGVTGGGIPKITLSTGKEVQVRKATAAQLSLILDLLKQIALHLKLTNFNDIGQAIAAIENPVDFLGMLAGSMEKLLELVASMCDLNEQTVKEGVDLDDLLLIVWAEYKLNEHFFMTRLLPLILKLDTGGQFVVQEEADQQKEDASATAS